ncbi:MAG TPA: hypothetical protein VH518_16355 [Tepidisphaeraceae bacterium]|jgi:hypothetical protein
MTGEDKNDDPRGFMEIPVEQSRRWLGLVAYVLLFLVVAALLVLLFMWFTASLRLAIGLVLFLVGYMVLMGWWAGRNIEGRD